MLICGVIASVNTGMVEFGLDNWNFKQLPLDLMELLLNYVWKFPSSLVCTAEHAD